MDNNQHSTEEIKDLRFKEPTFIDPLTGLFNQYYLYRFLPEEIKKAKLGNYPLVLLMIDLDGFKEVNDTYGHLCGDEILKQLSAIIKKSVRQTDMIVRYAGDEFLILLPAADLKRAEILSHQLIENVDKNAFKSKEVGDIHLTISIGFSVYPYDTEQVDKLIDGADKALYLSKQKGKNQVSHAKEVTLEAVSSLVAMDSFPCLRFIDRQEEIDRLKYILDTMVLKSNLLQLAFISGGAGIGKTRLLNELNNYIQERAVVISSRAYSTHTQEPYYLFANGISAYIEKMGIDNVQLHNLFSQIPYAELVELSYVVPALVNLIKKPMDLGSGAKETRFLLFKGFLDILIELNKTSAVLISFDDLQWADKASLELLRYLSKQEKNKRIFIVCSFTEDKITKDNNLNELQEDIRFNDNFTSIKLNSFSLEDTSLMIEAIFPGIGAKKEFCELIYDATKGNPSFIEEILKSLVENAVIFYQDNRWQIKKSLSSQDIPYSLEEVIKKRLKNLDEETKEMIVQAAVIGEDFSIDLLKKVGNKDEGFMLELLNRAKKMRLVDELEQKGKFGFINKNVQNVLYNELNDEQKNQLHYKVGQALAEEHKDNLYNVVGDLAFHFSKMPQQDNAGQYRSMLLEKSAQLFNSTEILEYLDKLAKEVIVEEERIPPLPTDKLLNEAMRFIRFLQGAIKNFHLYPPGIMRTNAVKEVYSTLDKIWEEVARLNLGEVEKGLVINGKRISPKELEQGNAEYFLTLMMEYNLKTISFKKGITQNELDKFIQYLSSSFIEIRNKGGWAQLINNEGIKGIKIDEVRFIQVGGLTKEFEGKKKIEDIMLMEFLLGKIERGSIDKKAIIQDMEREPKKFAQTIMDAASKALKEGKTDDEVKAITDSIEKINSEILSQEPKASDYAKNLAQVILELRPTLRNKIIRSQLLGRALGERDVLDNIVKTAPDEVIIDMIIEEYRENQENLLAVKDYIDTILTDVTRKKIILSKLETELLKFHVPKQDIAFIIEEEKWENLPLEKRINNIIRLPSRYYKLELERIKSLLEELDANQKKQELESVLFHLIAKLKEIPLPVRKDLVRVITDFIKTPLVSDREVISQMEDRLGGLLKKINIEAEPDIFAAILEIFTEIIKDFTVKIQSATSIVLEIEKPQTERYCLFIYQLLYILSKRFQWEENRNLKICQLIKGFVSDVSSDDFLETLVYFLVRKPPQERDVFKNTFFIIGNKLVDTLIDLEIQRARGWGDSFQAYLIRRGKARLLIEMGEPALNRLRQRLLEMKENISIPLIELVGHLKKEELVDSLLPLTKHADPLVRRAVIMALGDIGTEKGIKIISLILKEEKDKKIRSLAKKQLARLMSES